LRCARSISYLIQAVFRAAEGYAKASLGVVPGYLVVGDFAGPGLCGPIAMAAMFSVAVVVLADVRYLPMDDGGEPVREPAPSDPASVQLRLTVEGDGEVIITPPAVVAAPGRPTNMVTARETKLP
jgi:hypothetical protein